VREEKEIESITMSMMNETGTNFSIPWICDICQASYGFSSAERRSIIVLVVLTGIALIACYIGVLWYAIRARYKSEDKLTIISDQMNTNQAFDEENELEDIKGNISTISYPVTMQPMVIEMEKNETHF
jgi:hypothetical protein